MNSHKYFYDEYYNDISSLALRYKTDKNIHVVGLYSDSLPVAVHLSNVLSCPMSIVRMVDTYEAEWVFNRTEDESIRPNNSRFFPRLIVPTTVYDSGNQFKAIKQLPEFINNPDYTFFALFGCKNDDNVFYKHEQVYKNILFPWHGIREDSVQSLNF